MILYPAIDLKDGNAVRLLRGDMNKSTVFNKNPSDQAIEFERAGCHWLHLVDLNGAFAGEPVNSSAVEEILSQITIPAQLGGGIRSLKTIENWIQKGLSRIILGTVAVENPLIVKEAAKEFPGKIAVGVDARDGLVATDGWAKSTNIKATELAKSFEDYGVCSIIYTDINRDGAMQGPNVRATAKLANEVSVPIIASGGVSKLDDLIALKSCGAKLNGVISGRALYDGAINLQKALEIL